MGADGSDSFECPDNHFDIYLHDLTTGEEPVLDESGANNTMPDTQGDRVVWRDLNDEGSTAIHLYDIDTRERRKVASPSLCGVDWPQVSGDYLVRRIYLRPTNGQGHAALQLRRTVAHGRRRSVGDTGSLPCRRTYMRRVQGTRCRCS